MNSWVRLSVILAVIATTSVAFFNCGRIAPADLMTASSLGIDSCSNQLKVTYQSTYFPFLSTSCNSCHGNAHGSKDLGVSFNSFLSKSISVIDYKATTAHGGNAFSASVNQPIIDAFRPSYMAAYADYTSCKARIGNGDGFDLQLASVAMPVVEIPTNNDAKWKTVIWNTQTDSVNSEMALRFKATVKIDVRAYVVNGQIVGLQFREPKVQLQSGQADMSIQGLRIRLNNRLLDAVTAYASLNANITGSNEVSIGAGLGSPSAVVSLLTSNTISLDLMGLSPTLIGGDGPSVPPIVDGGNTGNLPSRVTYAELTATGGVFARACVSCHNAGNAAGGLNLSNYNQARSAAANIVSRMNDANRPMPTSGILDQRSRELVRIWMDGGAPQN